MRCVKVLLLVAALALPPGCGWPELAADIVTPRAPPVVLHEITWRPGCFTELDETLITDTSSAVDAARQRRAELTMYYSFAVQTASLLSQPVLADPTALNWLVEGEQFLIEGNTYARGEGWGILFFGVRYSPSESAAPQYWGAEIRYSPETTLFSLESTLLIYGDGYAIHDDVVRGCDPYTGVSFELGPWVIDGALVDRALLCWRDPAIIDPPLDRTALCCRQAAHAVLSDQAPAGALTAPAAFLY